MSDRMTEERNDELWTDINVIEMTDEEHEKKSKEIQEQLEEYVPELKQEKTGARFREIFGVLHKNQIIKGITPEKVRHIIEDLGPTFIKLGQIMSSQSNILPKEYCEELEKLRSDVPPMPIEQVYRILEKEYGRPVKELFRDFHEKPIGSASIGQAHIAELQTGEKVVLKVQREGIYDTMERDMDFLQKAVKILHLNKVGGAVDFGMVLNELWEVEKQELNFQIEAGNLEEFTHLNANVAYVACPKLYRALTTKRVLVMEYIEGCSIGKRNQLLKDGYDLEEIGKKLVNNYLKQILEDGFFHADPHSGNIFIRKGKIVWIDMGMMGRLSKRERELLDKLIGGVARKDCNMIKDALLSLGIIKGRIDHHKLYMDINDIVTKYASANLGGINLSVVMEEIFDAMKRNKIEIPGNLTMLVRGLATIEGVVAQTAPDIDVISIASDHMGNRMLSKFDLKEELKRNGSTLVNSIKKALDIPGVASDLLHMTINGQTHLNLDLHSTRDLSRLLINLVRDIVLGLLVAALLIGSSIICLTEMKPQILEIPVLGFFGFVLAFILAVWLFIQHIRAKKDEE